ncbi:MAG: hypothetical protein PHH54_06405 [Candidatus Nanoarchaeia archaeon]|nr:hypothetical protein [Candidatus Nanoarchaeia archaeon]MDD5741587.1 hypothetical protein [Candidatus Nanoarchaeia archaeon]
METEQDEKQTKESKLKKIVEQAYVLLAGNRLTLMSELMIGSGLFLSGDNHPTLKPLLGMIGFPVYFVTVCGLQTLSSYNRTIKHIKKFEKLDERFAKEQMGEYKNNLLMGYCQLQGMYLASKKYNQLDEFYKLKKKISEVIIPNF